MNMEKISCTINGNLDDSKFNEPIPWIGLYVVAASAACAIAMAIDAFHGFRYRKFWFPCKWFALNATTLTIIAVAVKLSVDLNTSMPRSHDQLTKLSSTAFMCTVIGNSLPSLGTMRDKEMMMNVLALGILVITIIVNVCIQLGTGVIYVFFIEHVVVMLLMVILFAIVVSLALAFPAIKFYLDLKYNKKYKIAKTESINHANDSITQRLTDDLERYWVMAHTCNPQFVMGRLATCTASGAFCLLSALILAEAMLRTYLMPSSFRFCDGQSDYKWSSIFILVTQAVGVGVGTIAPAARLFTAIKFTCPHKAKRACRLKFLWVEKYWISKLHHLKESTLDLRFCGRRGRKLVHNTKNKVLDVCIWIQKAVVVSSKSVRLTSIYSVYLLLIFLGSSMKLVSLFRYTGTNQNIDAESEANNSCKLDLSRYVLLLEGEDNLENLMMGCDRDATGHWIRMGRKEQPRHLIRLLERLGTTRGFEGVYNFDSDQVPSLDLEEPPNSWALPVVTLTSIAIAVGNTNFHLVKELINCVHEGLIYIRVVENSLDIKRDLVNIRKAAENLWAGVELHYKWLDVDLREMASQGKCPRDIISQLSDIAKNKFSEYKKNDIIGCLRDSPSKWPGQLLAANSMYRVCQTLLLTTDHKSNECIIESLTAMITGIIGAALTNLEHAISIKCHHSSIEEREEIVRFGIFLLGKSEKILEILSCQPLPSSDPEQLACINEWRALSKERNTLACDSSPTTTSTGDSNFSTSPDLYLNIM
ncbi:hypothetical protein F511_04073 [Dorcoceras hygrometricum]|uniref:Uncharacterized protein n=1 Tax=Dorcoceras hygrometricum TaxID=472368 RepID=A0A2Z7CF61_9LAMI|nr:hypothetical protein F511_04073 [Dorcoceras hygrometricum]